MIVRKGKGLFPGTGEELITCGSGVRFILNYINYITKCISFHNKGFENNPDLSGLRLYFILEGVNSQQTISLILETRPQSHEPKLRVGITNDRLT